MGVASSISDGIFLFCFSKLKKSFHCGKPKLEKIYLLCNKAEKPPGFSLIFFVNEKYNFSPILSFKGKNTTSPRYFLFQEKNTTSPQSYLIKEKYNFSRYFLFLWKKYNPETFSPMSWQTFAINVFWKLCQPKYQIYQEPTFCIIAV